MFKLQSWVWSCMMFQVGKVFEICLYNEIETIQHGLPQIVKKSLLSINNNEKVYGLQQQIVKKSLYNQ